MRPAVAAPALALALLALAGCADEGPGGDTTSGADGTADQDAGAVASSLVAPAWEVGQAWTLQSPQQGEPFTHVVSADAGDDWVVDTDSQTTAYFDARFDISFLGKVRKSDLAGSQGSTRVEFLRFPLTQDLEWTTTWDGAPTTVKAIAVADGKATLEARRGDGTLYAAYTYDSRPGYFTSFAFYGADGTTVGFEWSLQQASRGHAGPLVRWQMQELHASSGPIPSGYSAMFTVPAGFTDVYVDGNLQCASGAVMLAVGPPSGPAEDRGYSNFGPCPLSAVDQYPVSAPEAAEQWGALLTGAPGTQGTLELHIYGRTLVQFQPGQAPS